MVHYKMCFRYCYIALVVLQCYIFETQQINSGLKPYDNTINNDKLMQDEFEKIDALFNNDLRQGFNVYMRESKPDIKKSLDTFKMKRKLTHFTLPPNPELNKKPIDRKISQAVLKQPVFNTPIKIPRVEIPIHSNYDEYLEYQKKPMDHKILKANPPVFKTSIKTPRVKMPIIPNSEEYLENQSNNDKELFYDNPTMFNILKNQTELMEKIIEVLEDDLKRTDKKNLDKDFEEELGVNDIPSPTVRDPKNYRITTPRQNITIVNTIDELKMREKLKNDPFVKRIIAMAKLKRKQYFEKLSTFTPDP